VDLQIRNARRDDIPAIESLTANTFEWGDYIPGVIEDWLESDSSVVLVACDDDVPIAMAKASMLSTTEAWFSAARVHPEWRGRGIAGTVAGELDEWARFQGALVGRLVIEDWNEASIKHVEKIGMRPVSRVVRCTRTVTRSEPAPGGNGGKRVPAQERLRPTRSAEAEPAFMSWSAGELGRATRGLFAIGWSFRRLTVADLVAAARIDALWETHTGWAMGAPAGDQFSVGWVETRPDDADDFMRAIVDLSAASGAESLAAWIPEIDWALTAAERSGCELSPMSIWAKEL
jgi:GNAT superfamily N-acetyltransferase